MYTCLVIYSGCCNVNTRVVRQSCDVVRQRFNTSGFVTAVQCQYKVVFTHGHATGASDWYSPTFPLYHLNL